MESGGRILDAGALENPMFAPAIPGAMSLAWAALTILPIAAWPAAAQAETTPYRAQRALFGAWTHDEPQPTKGKFREFTTRCFEEGRAPGGGNIESDGEGREFCQRLRVVGNTP